MYHNLLEGLLKHRSLSKLQFDSVGLVWKRMLRVCICNKIPSDPDAAGPREAHFENHCFGSCGEGS